MNHLENVPFLNPTFQSISTDSTNVTREGTYSQEKHAVHGKRGVAGVEGKPARKEKTSSVFFLLNPEDTELPRTLQRLQTGVIFSRDTGRRLDLDLW